MNDLYRIKPLVWKKTEYPRYHYWSSETPIGRNLYITLNTEGYEWRYNGGDPESCNSLEDGKAKCQAHYIAFISQALEEVK